MVVLWLRCPSRIAAPTIPPVYHPESRVTVKNGIKHNGIPISPIRNSFLNIRCYQIFLRPSIVAIDYLWAIAYKPRNVLSIHALL
jgi:hypothetical protein